MPPRESKWIALIVAGLVCAVISLGSIVAVRYANRNRAVTPGIALAATRLDSVPDSLVILCFPEDSDHDALEVFSGYHHDFTLALTSGALPVDSVRGFYQSYALWMRDGDWDSSDVAQFGAYLGIQTPRP